MDQSTLARCRETSSVARNSTLRLQSTKLRRQNRDKYLYFKKDTIMADNCFTQQSPTPHGSCTITTLTTRDSRRLATTQQDKY